jgi:hypothetical protein
MLQIEDDVQGEVKEVKESTAGRVYRPQRRLEDVVRDPVRKGVFDFHQFLERAEELEQAEEVAEEVVGDPAVDRLRFRHRLQVFAFQVLARPLPVCHDLRQQPSLLLLPLLLLQLLFQLLLPAVDTIKTFSFATDAQLLGYG